MELKLQLLMIQIVIVGRVVVLEEELHVEIIQIHYVDLMLELKIIQIVQAI